MLKRTFSEIILAMLLTSILALPFSIRIVKASGTIYIRADGSIDPPSAPIARNGNIYTFTDNINDVIVVEKSNIIIDGNGYTLQGSGSGDGFSVSNSSVTIQHTEIKNFGNGIRALSNDMTIINNVVSNCVNGIVIHAGRNHRILSNVISQFKAMGIGAISVQNLTIESNIITDGYDGIHFGGLESSIIGNIISNNSQSGLYIAAFLFNFWGSSNVIKLNDIINNQRAGMEIDSFETQAFYNNSIYHNNMVNNTQQIMFNRALGANNWDDGYPSGGNYWSNYNGTDLFRGVYQDMIGSDGIGDTPYFITMNNTDRYPFMTPLVRITAGANVTVSPSDDIDLTFENVTKTGSASAYKTDTPPEWLPSLPRLVGQYIDVTVIAGHFGTIMIKVTYDDSNMTQEEENSLQLLQWSGCDVTGPTLGMLDGVVNMRDIGLFCSKFMIRGGSDMWEPRCDVTGPTPGMPDGIVNMRDIGEACSNFMGTNHWADITAYIDTENNIIYGETTHFSMFGVTRE